MEVNEEIEEEEGSASIIENSDINMSYELQTYSSVHSNYIRVPNSKVPKIMKINSENLESRKSEVLDNDEEVQSKGSLPSVLNSSSRVS